VLRKLPALELYLQNTLPIAWWMSATTEAHKLLKTPPPLGLALHRVARAKFGA
jgi:hypothetical protein